jgi:hypothetical protein
MKAMPLNFTETIRTMHAYAFSSRDAIQRWWKPLSLVGRNSLRMKATERKAQKV